MMVMMINYDYDYDVQHLHQRPSKWYLVTGFADICESQAIWCALYKQSPGDEGWQVGTSSPHMQL